jgi:hypothetical protein
MKALVPLLLPLTLLLINSARAEPRIFTSPDGRTIEGEITSATTATVTLKLTSGQSVTASVDRFSAEDQAVIAEWRKANPQPIQYSFAVTYSPQVSKGTKTSRGGYWIIPENWVCRMKVSNRSNVTLENLTLDYNVFYKSLETGSPVLKKLNASIPIPVMHHLQEQEFFSRAVAIHQFEVMEGYQFTKGARTRKKEQFEGITLTLSHEGKEVYRWSSPGVPTNADVDRKSSLFAE